ncbi:2-aminoethylphosphonate dioxygenase [Metarhizium brunneum]|uniref:2-aminoethylphosphonate dioxygenase n=1 Tax=Metarhizium brunneum TaxID=500148 RepID=A0A7D5V3Z6_9HYPO
MVVTDQQISFFREKGYLIIRDFLSPEEAENLQNWAQQVHDWKPTTESEFMPYEEVNASGKRVLCRTENFVDYHTGLNSLLRGEKLLGLLNELAGQPMHLFKEKINYKLAGSGGFAPHIDAVAYTQIKDVKHLTILLSVDPSNMTNGGLEVVDGSHEMTIPINGKTHCIEADWVDSQEWVPVELEAGQLLIFPSYLAHRSGPNNSSDDRKAIYATYNLAAEGDMHREYYEDRKKEWPATHMRKEGESYAKGALTYGFGSPMLSVDAGKQVAF